MTEKQKRQLVGIGERAQEYVELAEAGTITWKTAYHGIFSNHISRLLTLIATDTNIIFTWQNPLTGWEPEVRAFMAALKQYISQALLLPTAPPEITRADRMVAWQEVVEFLDAHREALSPNGGAFQLPIDLAQQLDERFADRFC